MPRPAQSAAILVSTFLAAALLSSACKDQDYPSTAFRCDPSSEDPCPASHVCCSTDPSAFDIENISGTSLPDYAGGSGEPLFSGVTNAVGRYGRCVDTTAVGGVETLADTDDADGCPRPCNPTWSDADVATVCGADAFCCQTDELEEPDCVFDPAAGSSGCWRPVSGRDIVTLGGLDASDWGASDHATHQDPRGDECRKFVEGFDMATLGAAGVSASEAEKACYRKLTVANQRGLCTAAGGETDVALVCPLADPAYRDACEQMNDDEGLGGCAAVEFP